jgi:pimeloyl-ACP methyl ester carboxylesterase
MIAGERGRSRLYHKINLNPAVSQNILDYQRLIGENFNSRNELIPLLSDQELKRLTMPVLMFLGQKDIIISVGKTAKRLGSLLPNARISILPSIGHTLINLADKVSAFID